MKTRNQWRGVRFVLGMIALCTFVVSAQSAVLIDEVFDTGYNRTLNNIAGTNMAWFKSRSNASATITTGNPGSLSFSASTNNGADAYFGYFTDPAANFSIGGTSSSVNNGHLLLGVGDTLFASVTFYLTTMPSDTSTAALRFGLFDTYIGRSMNDFNGGASSSMFTNNPGFATFVTLQSASTNNGVSIYRHTGFTNTGLMGTSADFTQIDGSIGGTSVGATSGEKLTMKFSVSRPSAGEWDISSELIDTLTSSLLQGGSVSTSDGVSSFSYIGVRLPRMPDSTFGPVVFSDLNVSVSAIPEPSTLVLAASGLALAIMAIRRRRS